MKKTIAILLLLASPGALAAPPAHVVAAPVLLGAQGEILAARMLAAGYGGQPSMVVYGGAGAGDPIVPVDGSQNITGGLTLSSNMTVSGTTYTGRVTNSLITLYSESAAANAVGPWAITRSGVQKWASYAYGTDARFVFLINPSSVEVFSYVPSTTSFDMTGSLTASSTVRSDGGFLGTILKIRTGTTMSFLDASDNVMGRFVDGGTYGTLALPSDSAQIAVGATAAEGVGAVLLKRQGTGGAYLGSTIGSISLEPASGAFTTILTRGGLAVGGVTAVKSAAYTATVADSLVLADPNAAAGSFAVTLPAASAAKGQLICVRVTATHATRVITVIDNGGDTIEGSAAAQSTITFTTTAALAGACLQSDGTSKWYTLSTFGTAVGS